jgi:hypothetical protein
LEECVASEEGFEDYAERLAKDANTMIVISLALGLHDQDSRYKAVAGGMMRAARDMATAEDFAAARTAVGSLKEAIASGSDPATVLGWEKVASLPELMKKVPLINTTLKGRVRRPERKTEDSRGQCAVLAVIAQGTLANADETIEPEEVEKWQQYSIEMREAAASLNAAYRAMDTEAIRRITIEDLQQSCDRCHAVFAPEQVGAADLEGE